jgi:hypothetical protein
MTHPYVGLHENQYWRSGVSGKLPGDFDPVSEETFSISKDDRIATLGSCFAQHIARAIQVSGYSYFVGETCPEGVSQEVQASYEVFSARYGNVYTVRQALQLLQRALGLVHFGDLVSTRDGRWYDDLRPAAHPGGFESRESALADRELHLQAVKRVLVEADVMVFTLGLTEGWVHRESGAVFPMAPGVLSGAWDPRIHEFVNFDHDAVRQDLTDWLTLLRSVNQSARVILTVSPVPLAATYESRHVSVSTSYSKSVLISAAVELSQKCSLVDYFPSYEVILSPLVASRYFDFDLRHVRQEGVAHVMRLFSHHYLSDFMATGSRSSIDEHVVAQFDQLSSVICDEEILNL